MKAPPLLQGRRFFLFVFVISFSYEIIQSVNDHLFLFLCEDIDSKQVMKKERIVCKIHNKSLCGATPLSLEPITMVSIPVPYRSALTAYCRETQATKLAMENCPDQFLQL